jgi:hypothetical protein
MILIHGAPMSVLMEKSLELGEARKSYHHGVFVLADHTLGGMHATVRTGREKTFG